VVYIGRPRDKINRPQTRRRRENNEESLDKMRTLRQNLVKAYEVHEWLTRREARKYSLVVRCSDFAAPLHSIIAIVASSGQPHSAVAAHVLLLCQWHPTDNCKSCLQDLRIRVPCMGAVQFKTGGLMGRVAWVAVHERGLAAAADTAEA
jgi:hypothetical protein